MKITDRNNITPVQLAQPGRTHRLPESRGKAADRVSVSSEARQLKQADAERIAALTRAIAEGQYKVDIEALAEAIVHKELM